MVGYIIAAVVLAAVIFLCYTQDISTIPTKARNIEKVNKALPVKSIHRKLSKWLRNKYNRND